MVCEQWSLGFGLCVPCHTVRCNGAILCEQLWCILCPLCYHRSALKCVYSLRNGVIIIILYLHYIYIYNYYHTSVWPSHRTCPGHCMTARLLKRPGRHIRDARLPLKGLRNFYTCTIESIFRGRITIWMGSCKKQDLLALRRVVSWADYQNKPARPAGHLHETMQVKSWGDPQAAPPPRTRTPLPAAFRPSFSQPKNQHWEDEEKLPPPGHPSAQQQALNWTMSLCTFEIPYTLFIHWTF